ncbi:hypothetical protein [Motilibacter aurantiacus]|uniref:hypothetical protein n=1 Tax=Motilibacter aurantiacus TaxID=2714955 RepID=UPI00140AC742|nr:hypothetical protein [Motilibacter aurantiacus]NHC45320.1 hypothetical protein [Motilibacter aurantiacus]
MRRAPAALPLAVALVLAACGTGSDTSTSQDRAGGTAMAPTRPADCNHVSLQGTDAAAAVGFHWTGEEHPYGTAVTLWFCVDPRLGGSVAFGPPEGVTVSPATQPNPAPGTGVLPFTVTVPAGASGRVRVRASDPDGRPQADIGGPEIVAAESGWRFSEPGR